MRQYVSKIHPTVAIFTFGFALCLLALVQSLLPVADSLPPRTTILGYDYSLLTRQKALDKMAQDFPLPISFTLIGPQVTYNLVSKSVDAKIDFVQTIDKIQQDYRSSRGHNLLLLIFPRFSKAKNYQLSASLSPDLLAKNLETLTIQLQKPFVPTQMQLKNKQVIITPGQLGQDLDLLALNQQLLSSLSNYNFPDNQTFPFKITGNLPDASSIKKTEDLAKTLVGKSIVLSIADQKVNLDDQTLIDWLDFSQNFKSEPVAQFMQATANSINKDAQNATFQIQNNKVEDFQPARPGVRLDPEDATSSFLSQVSAIFTNPSPQFQILLPYVILEPSIKTGDVNNLGIKELLGRGVSSFKHSSATRNINVARGAAVVNRILVAPGETFSFTKNLGTVDAANGFKEAYVIKAEGTQLEYGGGVCQVSTTLFRAMLNAGVNIIARKNHSYRVSYYEEDMPPGYDATVYTPNPDLQFINDTPAYILVQNYFDGKNKTLTYEIWGTKDGRQSEIKNYRQWGSSPPPPAKYIDDPGLPKGTLIRTETPVGGLKTSFDWRVTKDGQVLYQKTFNSNFVPWAAVYRRGTGV